MAANDSGGGGWGVILGFLSLTATAAYALAQKVAERKWKKKDDAEQAGITAETTREMALHARVREVEAYASTRISEIEIAAALRIREVEARYDVQQKEIREWVEKFDDEMEQKDIRLAAKDAEIEKLREEVFRQRGEIYLLIHPERKEPLP